MCQAVVCPFDCYNHGTCKHGTCVCVSGWSGEFCNSQGGNVISPSQAHGVFVFYSSSFTVLESAQQLSLPVSRQGGTTNSVSVSAEIVGGSALPGVDFYVWQSHLVWEEGDSQDKSLSFLLIQDYTPEQAETFKVKLTAPQGGAVLGEQIDATITIAANQEVLSADSVLRVILAISTPWDSLSSSPSKKRNFLAADASRPDQESCSTSRTVRLFKIGASTRW
eukprot:gb/GEZN01007339.1/.p1 GENE.gb/GEZN01007339.1/~~gb/GEZN01007339.1/.p1  ORF type:complete len:222 (-),score=35.15 gb/GEZN01007339.1/:506-1171(-)